MTTATIPQAVGDYTTFKHKVYVGLFRPHPEVMFVKVGMTSDVQGRLKQYAGMVPGGLHSMYTGRVPTRGAALMAEKAVLCKLAESDKFEAIGGEWFKCEPLSRYDAIEELERVVGNLSQARIVSPTPFAGGKRGRRTRRRR